MRLVTRAELRSVTCAGSMVTGSARRPMTMASLGGAAAAPDTRAKARITSAIIQVRRVVIGAPLAGSVPQPACARNPIPSPPEGERAAGRAETLASSEEARAEMGEGGCRSLEAQ